MIKSEKIKAFYACKDFSSYFSKFISDHITKKYNQILILISTSINSYQINIQFKRLLYLNLVRDNFLSLSVNSKLNLKFCLQLPLGHVSP